MSVQQQSTVWPWVRYPTTTWTFLTVTALLVAWWFLHWWQLAAGAGAVVAVVVVYRTQFRATQAIEAEKQRQLDLRGGWATPLDMVRALGFLKLRWGTLSVLRPSLAALPLTERLRVPAAELGVRLVRIRGWMHRRWLYASIEWVVAVIAPPRSGKTSYLLNGVLDAPGPVVTTSMKIDVVEETIELRRAKGPVWIFNPHGLGGDEYVSTFKWDPLVGCTDPEQARFRAAYLMSGTQLGDGGQTEFFTAQSVRVFAVFLHAAALAKGKLSIFDVQDWIARAYHDQQMQNEIRALLSSSPEKRSMLSNFDQLLETNDRTYTSTTTTMRGALEWLSSPGAADLVRDIGDKAFDVEAFLDGTGTLYLLAEHRPGGGVEPLFAAFTGYLYDSAKLRASKLPKGRLDPPLTMVLDEVANTCPVPLPIWTSVAGSHNIPLLLGFQSLAQIRARWGEEGARIILENIAVKMYLAGGSDVADLRNVAELFGTVRAREFNEATKTYETRDRTVLSPAKIRNLSAGDALLVAPGLAGVAVGSIRPYYKRHDYKAVAKKRLAAARAETKRARLALTAEPAPVPDDAPVENRVPSPREEPLSTEEAQARFDMEAMMRAEVKREGEHER